MTAFTGRREFVTLLGGAAASSAAYAQEVDKSRKIGIVFPRPAAAATDNIAGLKSGLQERGYIEGQNSDCRMAFLDRQPAEDPVLS